MRFKHGLRKVLWRLGYDIIKFAPESQPIARKIEIFRSYHVDMVLDIGANSGQFAKEVRNDIGYKGLIYSFEPLSVIFDQLKNNAKNDLYWKVFNCAMGDVNHKTNINISSNSYSSSLLDILPSHLKSEPNSHYVGTEVVEIKTLDSVFNELCGSSKNIYMKIDTQGFESKVLKGAVKSLDKIDTVQIEMSLVPLYKEEILAYELIAWMGNKGYTLIAIENGFSDPDTGQLLQIDGIFHRF